MTRNYYLIFILSFILFITKANAQNFNGGFIIGPTMTDIDGADLTDNDNDFHKLGISVGGLVNHKVGKTSLLQMELAYMIKGSSQPLDSGFIPYTINLQYIDVSFLFKHPITFTQNKFVNKVGFEFGVTMGTIISSTTKDSTNYKYPLTVNKFDLELLVGAYYNLSQSFYVNLRYSNSIIHAIPHHNGFVNFYPYFTLQKGNNLVFQLTLGYVIKSKKGNTTP